MITPHGYKSLQKWINVKPLVKNNRSTSSKVCKEKPNMGFLTPLSLKMVETSRTKV